MTTDFETIEKEAITSLHFPKTDVLNDRQAMYERANALNRAQALGNLEHSKIRIYFEDDLSKKMVETTVWGVTDDRIILKKGSSIPINRIYQSL